MTATEGLVGLVFISHSSKIADGLLDLATQMAPQTRMVPAGGTDDGGIGTSFTKVVSGIAQADAGAGVVLLCDLGSAILTAETALDFLGDAARARVRIVDAPLVEGGVAAAVAAEIGGDIESVVRAAQSAAGAVSAAGAEPALPPVVTRTVTLVNKDGLHARPAADFVKLANTFEARVTVNGRDASSLLAVMSLGLIRGMTAKISSSDEAGAAAVAALGDLLESGFGEE
ncbi:HPr family phosphocarrier protein [Cryobacterium sp. TMT1-62]|uniref:Phosphocarrier protein HPr n=1 Tax=Cryobacterium sandaracinum TaxID=1259247 RepID=A0ABY2JBW3_9MICO|nr:MULTISPECIES: dihydroxyacetone kinase phosphoryl donor subunit DhaM [Cryobacterium]TFB54916.1 HPr family phosphocarrier protein [Cryobacterium sp. Sr3]TFC53166.1 HPr family phosphocarrier protein [Cryobacterium sp. TMT2-17-1]TFC65968.1 HPr family phosphocarrier protein [Cryobacterium sp. TMT2-4]TFD02459.1 HPr family phosphocarrier protein [Cryobacterium sandaracinum]TFD31912.1 HPr family phosphocarrier protein [Cryobacterium sp. TMT1-62]